MLARKLLFMICLLVLAGSALAQSAPVINPIPDQTIALGQTFVYQVNATDADNDTIIFNATLPISQAGLITYLPSTKEEINVTVDACDAQNCSSETFVLTVTDPFSNDQDSGLRIKDLVVRVDGDKVSGVDEDGGEIDEVKPGSEVKFEIEIENILDIDIEDVEVEISIFDIDDGDRLEDDQEISKIKDGKEETITFTFKIPLDVEENTYDVRITITGEDDDGNDHKVALDLTLEVEKEKHELRLDGVSLSPSQLSCQSSASLSVEVINTGREDEEDVSIKISNSALNLRQERSGIELEADDDDSYETRFTIDVAGAKPGSYPIQVQALFDDGDVADVDAVILTITSCAAQQTPAVNEPSQPQQASTDVVVHFEPGTQISSSIATAQTPKQIIPQTSTTVLALLCVVLLGAISVAAMALKKS